MAVKSVGIVLLVLGMGLLIFGAMEAEGIGAQVQEFFTGTPPDRVIWMWIGGAISFVLGLFLALYPAKSQG
jgi:TRAP-type C4-dicarboxylate transport system permease large subunit